MSIQTEIVDEAHADQAVEAPADLAPYEFWVDRSPLPAWIQAAAESFDVESLLEIVLPRCVEVAFPTFASDEQFVARLRSSISANAYALRSVIAGDLELQDVYLAEVFDLAAVQAQLRVPQMSIQRSYRASFFTMLEVWTDHVASYVENANVSAVDAASGQKLLTQTVLTYQDFVATQVARAHTRDYDLLSRSRTHMRRGMIREILRGAGEALSASDAAILAYDLANHHVAVLLPTTPETKATQLAARIRAAANCQANLVYPTSLTSTVLWFGRIDAWTERAADAVISVLNSAGVPASIGEARSGIDGFRSSLDQATRAERVRDAWGEGAHDGCVRFADVALESLLMQNPSLAREFIERELGALALDTPEALRLRETIEASCRLGSHVAAAEFLQLHEHTVRNRLQKVEAVIGHPLAQRMTELQVAVRLAKVNF